jgi:GNAT superfamily N-acetyltransferase
VNVRPLTQDDAAAIASMAFDDEIALRGHSHIGETDVLEWWSRTDLERDSWLFEEGGVPAAVGWFMVWGGKGAFAGLVAQGWKGRGIGTDIVERAEGRGRDRDLERMQTWIPPEDDAAVALLRNRGYEEVRRFYEMVIELESEPAVPELPAPLVLDEFREEDARAFHAATIESFQDHWDWHGSPFDEWWEMRKGQDRDEHGPLWLVVRDGDEIAAVIRNEANRGGGGYVGLLGVRRPWRGRGLGKALLYRTFAEFWQRGTTRVSLGVDAESPTGATKLYESVGMVVEAANAVYEK